MRQVQDYLIAEVMEHEDRAIRQGDTEVWTVVNRAKELVKDKACEEEIETQLGELDVFLSWRHYLDGEGEQAVAYAQSAIKRLPIAYESERGYAIMMTAASLQMVGRESEGIKLVYNTLDQERHASLTFRVRLFESLGYVLWMAGDLAELRDTGEAMLRFRQKEDLSDSKATGNCLMGMALFAMGDLEQAEQVLSAVFKPGQQPHSNFLIRATYVLAMTYEALGHSNQACTLLNDTLSYCLDTSNAYSLAMVKGFQAELALCQGRLADAEHWLATFEPSPTPMSYGPTVAELTAVKILYRQQTPKSLKMAAQHVYQLKAYFEKIHNTRFLIEALRCKPSSFKPRTNLREPRPVWDKPSTWLIRADSSASS